MAGKLQISGEIFSDDASLKAYSMDMSHYSVKPQMVAVPANEEDIEVNRLCKARIYPHYPAWSRL